MLRKLRSLWDFIFRHRERRDFSLFIEKCQTDVWCFLLGTTSGTIFMFSSAVRSSDGKWLHLIASDSVDAFEHYREHLSNVIIVSGRGIDLRFDSIEWICDYDS